MEDLRGFIKTKFAKKKFGPVYFVGFSLIFLGGYGLLWYETNWKVFVAVFLISYGILLQAHMAFVSRGYDKS